MAEPLVVHVDDEVETVHVDPETGTIEERQPDGGVVVHLDAARRSRDEEQKDDWFGNLVDEIDHGVLSTIASDLISAIEADDKSRASYLETRAAALELLGTKLEKPGEGPSDSVEGMSKVTNPLLLEACLKGWANAQAELLPADGPVKIKVQGDETSSEDDLAERLEADMNYYMTTTAREYYPDTSHMLLWGTYFGGSGFKKIYRCPMRRRPVSESIDAKDLIVSDTSKDLASCSRVTHQIPMRPSVMKRMQLIGAYHKVTLTQPTPQANSVDEKIAGIQGTEALPSRPEDQPYTVWESQCELDIAQFAPGKFKGEGIPLPYVVSIDKDSQTVLAVRRDWDEDDEDCTRLRMYVRYPYVPGPGFYGTGMLNILGNASAAMTAAWREALDAGMYANFPAGLMAKGGARQNSSMFRLAPGEFMPVETNGAPISQVVMGLPFKDVTGGLLTLIDKIVEQSRALGASTEIPTAEGVANVPVGTMLAQIEQATKVMAAAHKGMHQAQSEEIELLVVLFKRHPEDFWRQNKDCPKDYWNEQKFIQALEDCHLVPKSDPNVPSHIHRIAKALGLVQLLGIPQIAARLDPKELTHRVLRALREDPNGLMIDPPPQAGVDPKAQAALIAAQAKTVEAQAKLGKVQQDQTGQSAEMQIKQAEMVSKEKIAGANVQKELIIHEHDQEKLQAAERRDNLNAQIKLGSERMKAEQQQTKVGLELVKHGVAATQADREHAHDRDMAHREHGLATTTAERDHHHRTEDRALEQSKAAAEAAARAHEVLHPPKPAVKPAAKPKRKK